MLKLLVQSAHYAIEKYFTESLGISDGSTAGIYCLQSQGRLFNYHPHVHGLVLAGLMKEGIFYEQTNISTRVIGEIFRARLLTVLQQQGIITQELMDMLMTWNHNSGFNVHTTGRINGSDGSGIENIARACPVLDTGRDPALKPNLAPENPQEAWFSDVIPSVEVYIGEPEYTS